MKIYIGADHKGFELKQKIIKWLKNLDYNPSDQGAYEHNKDDDYTLYAEKVASLVGNQRGTRGILICGSGVGMNVAANKIDGVRASLGKSSKQVKAGRAHDDMNILVIAADYTSETQTKKMLKMFLNTDFDQKPHHKRRLVDIERIEANN